MFIAIKYTLDLSFSCFVLFFSEKPVVEIVFSFSSGAFIPEIRTEYAEGLTTNKLLEPIQGPYLQRFTGKCNSTLYMKVLILCHYCVFKLNR